MRNNYLYILFPIFTLFLASCEEIIEPDLSDFQAKLVMSSNFSPDKVLEVIVSQTRPITDPRTPLYVTNAIVEVYQEEQLIETLELVYQESISGNSLPPTYISKGFNPEIDIAYTIKVSAEGFDDIEATSTVPEAPRQVLIKFDNSTINEATSSTVDFNIEMSFEDDMTRGNFYHIILSQKLCEYEVTKVEDGGELLNDTTILAGGIPAPLEFDIINDDFGGIKYLDGQSILVSDVKFNGLETSFTIRGNFKYEPSRHIPGNFSVEIRNLSPEYYYYYTSLTEQYNAGNLDLSDPGLVIDNVNNGNGIFAGFNPKVETFSLDGN